MPLSRKDLDHANKKVKQRVLAVENSCEKEAPTPRGKCNCYSPEERAQIGKYALENINTRVAIHFSKVLTFFKLPNLNSPISLRE